MLRRDSVLRCCLCLHERVTSRWHTNVSYREKERNHYYKKYYGLSVDDLLLMCDKQGRKCGICPRDIIFPSSATHLDHDHDTGKVRALLCAHCNRGLGSFQDNPELLEKAAAYLRSHGK